MRSFSNITTNSAGCIVRRECFPSLVCSNTDMLRFERPIHTIDSSAFQLSGATDLQFSGAALRAHYEVDELPLTVDELEIRGRRVLLHTGDSAGASTTTTLHVDAHDTYFDFYFALVGYEADPQQVAEALVAAVERCSP